MSAAAVRNAVTNFLTGANIANLNKVYAQQPFDESGIPWDTLGSPGAATKCFGVIDVDGRHDEFIALDGKGGKRLVHYGVTFQLYFVDVGGDASSAQNKMDAILDAVQTRLRSDPSLGTTFSSSGILQAAVGDLRAQTVEAQRYGDGDTYGAWSSVDFVVIYVP